MVPEDEEGFRAPPNPELESRLTEYHEQLMEHCRLFEEELSEEIEDSSPGILGRLFSLETADKDKAEADTKKDVPPGEAELRPFLLLQMRSDIFELSWRRFAAFLPM